VEDEQTWSSTLRALTESCISRQTRIRECTMTGSQVGSCCSRTYASIICLHTSTYHNQHLHLGIIQRCNATCLFGGGEMPPLSFPPLNPLKKYAPFNLTRLGSTILAPLAKSWLPTYFRAFFHLSAKFCIIYIFFNF